MTLWKASRAEPMEGKPKGKSHRKIQNPVHDKKNTMTDAKAIQADTKADIMADSKANIIADSKADVMADIMAVTMADTKANIMAN